MECLDNMEESFEEYMGFFKTQPLKEKQKIILDQLKMLAGFTNQLCKNINVNNEVIINKELVDLIDGEYTEDDYAEALITYINSIQDSICDYANGISNWLDTIDNEDEQDF